MIYIRYNTSMSNAPATVISNPATSTLPVGRPPVVLNAQTWDAVTTALAAKSKLSVLAECADVSVPTMRKLLAEKFGARVQFERGRIGGVTLVAARRGRKTKILSA